MPWLEIKDNLPRMSADDDPEMQNSGPLPDDQIQRINFPDDLRPNDGRPHAFGERFSILTIHPVWARRLKWGRSLP